MKKGLLILIVIMAVTAAFAFPKGTINPGGTISYTSYKYNSDADASTLLTINPQVGYLIIDNLALDLNLAYQMDNDDWSAFGIGAGARYFFGNIYAGAGIMYQSESDEYFGEDFSVSATFLNVKAGYLLPIARNVFLDLGAKYDMGFGSYGGDGSGDNEQSKLTIGAGLQVFYMMKKL
ncbi:MAG: outer membrane beta-barrel protein [Candidatus Syntrophosphaera sp.]|nr:outer membrane beta-barrel protein [Candidatus Syntrophosphaera sp.]